LTNPNPRRFPMAKAVTVGGVIVTDADLKAMNAISKAMKELDAETQSEVVAWFKRKYDPATRPSPEANGQ
jgi:chorismate synthase